MLQRIFQMLQQLYIRILIDVLFYLWYEFCVNSVIYVKEIVIFACDFDMDSEYRNFVIKPPLSNYSKFMAYLQGNFFILLPSQYTILLKNPDARVRLPGFKSKQHDLTSSVALGKLVNPFQFLTCKMRILTGQLWDNIWNA